MTQIDRTWSTDGIICPYCKEEHEDADYYYDNQIDREYECGECGKVSMVSVEFTRDFTTMPRCDLNDGVCEFELVDENFIQSLHKCKICGNCKYENKEQVAYVG